MFGFSLRSQSNAALLHFPGNHYGKDVIQFRNELRLFLLSALHLSSSIDLFLSQCFFPLSINFLQLQQKGTLAKEEFCCKSHKRSYLSAAWFHLRKVILCQALSKQTMPCLQVSKISHPDTVIKVFSLSAPLIHIQHCQEFLSNLKSVLGQHNLLLLELMAPLSSMSTTANYNSLPTADKST